MKVDFYVHMVGSACRVTRRLLANRNGVSCLIQVPAHFWAAGIIKSLVALLMYVLMTWAQATFPVVRDTPVSQQLVRERNEQQQIATVNENISNHNTALGSQNLSIIRRANNINEVYLYKSHIYRKVDFCLEYCCIFLSCFVCCVVV